MRYLLDTHTLLWARAAPEHLSRDTLAILMSAESALHVNVAWPSRENAQSGPRSESTESPAISDGLPLTITRFWASNLLIWQRMGSFPCTTVTISTHRTRRASSRFLLLSNSKPQWLLNRSVHW